MGIGRTGWVCGAPCWIIVPALDDCRRTLGQHLDSMLRITASNDKVVLDTDG